MYQEKYEIVAHLQGLINGYNRFSEMKYVKAQRVIEDLEELKEKIMPTKEDKV